MLEKFRVDYIEQNFEHLDLDFEKLKTISEITYHLK
jgi:hypothetical protein